MTTAKPEKMWLMGFSNNMKKYERASRDTNTDCESNVLFIVFLLHRKVLDALRSPNSMLFKESLKAMVKYEFRYSEFNSGTSVYRNPILMYDSGTIVSLKRALRYSFICSIHFKRRLGTETRLRQLIHKCDIPILSVAFISVSINLTCTFSAIFT